MHSFLCVSAKFQPISASFTPVRREGRKKGPFPSLCTGAKLAKSAEISQAQRKECIRLQGSLFQLTSRYSPEIRILILYHRNPIQTLIWHPIAWALAITSDTHQTVSLTCPLPVLSKILHQWRQQHTIAVRYSKSEARQNCSTEKNEPRPRAVDLTRRLLSTADVHF